MSNEEITFLISLEEYQKGDIPPFALEMGRNNVRLAFNRKRQQVTMYRDWVVISMSPQDFKKIVKEAVTSIATEDDMHD